MANMSDWPIGSIRLALFTCES